MKNKRNMEEEFYNSQTYNTINKAGKVAGRVIYEVGKTVESVANEVDKNFNNNPSRNPYVQNRNSQHPYGNNPYTQNRNVQNPYGQNNYRQSPPPVRPTSPYNQNNWSQNQAPKVTKPYTAPVQNTKQKPKKEKRKFFLRGLQVFCCIAAPIAIVASELTNSVMDAILAVASIFVFKYLFDLINYIYYKIKDSKTEKKEEKKQEKVVVKKEESTGNSELDKVIKEGYEYIRQLKFANDAILDEGISDCIFRMEKSTKDIFDFVKTSPEKVDQIKKFMNYYLPTTLKLLVSYQRLNNQSTKGENIRTTMFNIEGMMETIASAFEKQLDSLFSQEAMDIQADISVFDSILGQEGLKSEEETMKI